MSESDPTAASPDTAEVIAARRRDAVAAHRLKAQAQDVLSKVRGLYPAHIRDALQRRHAAIDAMLTAPT